MYFKCSYVFMLILLINNSMFCEKRNPIKNAEYD